MIKILTGAWVNSATVNYSILITILTDNLYNKQRTKCYLNYCVVIKISLQFNTASEWWLDKYMNVNRVKWIFSNKHVRNCK